MKRFLLQISICLICFNLAGGYTFAVGAISQASSSAAPADTHLSEGMVVKKGTLLTLRAPQVNKAESDEDDSYGFQYIAALAHSQFTYACIPDFKLLNKHFLVHYGKAIKGSFPPLYLINSIFRL